MTSEVLAPQLVASVPSENTPMALIEKALSSGASVETLEKLFGLQERYEANEARKAFVVAMSTFKENPPKIEKGKHVRFDTSKGVTEYDHATLAAVCNAIGPALAKQGLSFRWETSQTEGMIKVTCIITHTLGHSERTFLQASADDSGGKNKVQAIGSTTSYLSRYTILSALGLATFDQDDDGVGSEREFITMEQVAELQKALDETNGNIIAFCQFMKVDSLAEIQAKNFAHGMAAIDAKRKKATAHV